MTIIILEKFLAFFGDTIPVSKAELQWIIWLYC